MIHHDNALNLRKRGIIRILVEAILLAAVRESLHRDIGGRAYVAVRPFIGKEYINRLEMENKDRLKGTGEIVIFNPDESVRLDVRIEQETVWLTQAQMGELFGVQRQAITKHLKNIFASGELSREVTSSILELVQSEGARKVKRQVELFNLDVIISVGFRVNTKRGIQFRQWANTVLKEYLLRGYAVNRRLDDLERRTSAAEEKIDFFVRMSLPPVEGIFFEGQIFDAYVFACDLVRRAVRRIILIDNYVDEKVLTLLDKRQRGVQVLICTKAVSEQLSLDIRHHNEQYPPLQVKTSSGIHDRFLIIDNDVYHLGASLKDLGKKLFAFSKMSSQSLSGLMRVLGMSF